MRLVFVGLALSLALLSSSRVSVWQTDQTVWADAAWKAPEKPRPAVNLAAAAIVRDDHEDADRWLDRAAALLPGRPVWEQDYTRDLVLANRALVRIGQGRRADADSLVRIEDNDPIHSARLQVCYQFGPCAPPEPR